MSISDGYASATAWILENGHRALLAITGGRFPHRIAGMPTLELYTTGRKSGQRRATLLTAPIFEPDRVVVVAYKGGHSDNPDWYKNLVANPDVEIAVDEVVTPMHARTASPDEKAQLWPQIISVQRGYGGYQKRIDRDIPVVILTPR